MCNHKKRIKKQVDHIILFTGITGAIIGGLENAPFEWEFAVYIKWFLTILITCFDVFKAYKIRTLVDELPNMPR